jgi:ribonuclease VapC
VEATDKVVTFVLDSWPVMEWLQERQPATAYFDALMERVLRDQIRVVMSRINFGEVLYSCWKLKTGDPAMLFADVEALPVEVISVDDELVIEAARIKSTCDASYADCFAAAVALRFDVPVITGDRDFRELLVTQPKLRIEWAGA